MTSPLRFGMSDPRFRVPEGATPILDASGLIAGGILTYADLCVAEAENILKAMNTHLKRRKNPLKGWFTEEYFRKVHRDMFEDVWDWAGQYRKTQTNVGVGVPVIREEIAKLCQDVAFWDSQKNPMSVLERAARLHHRVAWIHPFPNGNGRHARLLADIYLHSHGHPLPNWPQSDLAVNGATRSDYLQAMREADHGDFEPLMAITKRCLPRGQS